MPFICQVTSYSIPTKWGPYQLKCRVITPLIAGYNPSCTGYNTPFTTRLGHTTSVLAKDANFRSPQGIEFGCNQFGLVLSIGTCWFFVLQILAFSTPKKSNPVF